MRAKEWKGNDKKKKTGGESGKNHGKNGSVCKTSSPTTDQVMNSSGAPHRATNWLTACHHPIYGGSVSQASINDDTKRARQTSVHQQPAQA